MRVRVALVLSFFVGFAFLGGLPVAAQSMSGGSFVSPMSFFSSGGGQASDSSNVWSLADVVGEGLFETVADSSMTIHTGLYGSQVAAQADLSHAHTFPTAFKPSAGEDRITFRGMTTNVTIKIYTLTGRLVQTLKKSDPTTEDVIWWPVANSSGQALASGVYYYDITGDSGSHAEGKFMVIK